VKLTEQTIKENIDFVTSLSDEEFMSWRKTILKTVYSMIGFREEKNYKESDKLKDIINSVGIKFNISKCNYGKYGDKELYFFYHTDLVGKRIGGIISMLTKIINYDIRKIKERLINETN